MYGDGGQSRSFCYVSDEIEGIYRLFHSEQTEPVNIGNPAEFTIFELGQMVLELIGSDAGIRHLPLPTDDPKVRQPDIARAIEFLGWEPKVALTAGLESTIDYFKQLHAHGALRVPPVLTSDAANDEAAG